MTDATATENQGKKKYDLHMARHVRRVARQARYHRVFLIGSVIAGVTGTLIIILLDNFFGSQPWPKVIALVYLLAWIAIYSKFLLPFRIAVTCPSCNGQVNLNQDWICGWCGDEKQTFVMQTVVRYRVPLEPCRECEKPATAIACPHCKEDIVFNVDAYNEEQQYGAVKPGVAKLL